VRGGVDTAGRCANRKESHVPLIPVPLPARARARRFLAATGACILGLGLLWPAAPAGAADEGRVYGFGQAIHHGSPGEPVAGVAATPTGGGYWTVTQGGAVRAFGDATGLGSGAAGTVDITAARSGRGFWLAEADGGVRAFGGSTFHGSMGGKPLNSPIVGIAATPSGGGYWLVASDGGIFSFGDARFLGSMGGTPLAAPVTGIASTPSGKGYWMVAEDGGIFSFGDAGFRGAFSGGGVTSMAAAPKGMGYWLVTASGNVVSFGDAPDVGDLNTAATVVDITPRPQVDGFWLATGGARQGETTYRSAAGEPSDADFDKLAQCESGGNWSANGGSYEGGLQFMNSTWIGYGGGEFAGHAYDATRLEQIEIGRRVWRERGWEPWPHCSRAVGLR
jgi:hypothetical protein